MARVSARVSVVSGQRPDSNLTGFSTLALPVIGKGLQLFKEIAPNVTRVEALFSPSSPSIVRTGGEMRTTAGARRREHHGRRRPSRSPPRKRPRHRRGHHRGADAWEAWAFLRPSSGGDAGAGITGDPHHCDRRHLAGTDHPGPPDGPRAEPVGAASGAWGPLAVLGSLPLRQNLGVGCLCGPGATVAAGPPQQPAASAGGRGFRDGPRAASRAAEKDCKGPDR
jgi:hypothetical protein